MTELCNRFSLFQINVVQHVQHDKKHCLPKESTWNEDTVSGPIVTTEITELWNRVKNLYRYHAHKRSPNVDNSPSF